MSVVIGVRCSDGIVLGSDSAASLMSQGTVTAQQRSMKKVVANGRVLSGVTGHTGLGQRIRAELESHLNGDKWTGDRQAVVLQMRKHLLHGLVETEMRAAKLAFDAIGHASCADAARTETLVASIIDGRPELVHLNETCAPSLIENDMPFCSIGAGQLTADPFLAFVRRILWSPGVAPTISTAVFSVAWTLSHVIDANPNGIGDPMQLGVLTNDGNDWVAREMAQGEIQENTNSVREAEQGIRDSFSKKGSGDRVEPPPK